LCLTLLIASCVNTQEWKEQRPPWTSKTVAGANHVRITSNQGELITLDQAKIESVEGRELLLGQRKVGAEGTLEKYQVPLTQVVRLEVSHTDAGLVALDVVSGIGLLFAGLLVLAVVLLASG
jgi:hypothetical protein